MLMKSENTSQQVFPLAMASEGEWVKIVSVHRGKNLAKRMITMGIIENTELHILQRQHGRSLVVICGETRLALGAGMANKIMVTPIQRNLNDVF